MLRPQKLLRKYLSCFLVALIALQSVVVAADNHQFHQSDQRHLEFNHSHSAASVSEQQAEQTDPSSLTDLSDCHHCCHCHGSVHFFPGMPATGLNLDQAQQPQSEYRLNNISRYTSPDLRPPIA